MIKHGWRDEEIRNRKIKKKKKNSQKAKKLDCGIHILTTNFSAGRVPYFAMWTTLPWLYCSVALLILGLWQ